jgi:hypothetical protein
LTAEQFRRSKLGVVKQIKVTADPRNSSMR